MLKNLNFKSERLITCRLSNDDAQALFGIYSDHEAMKFRANPPMQSLEEAYQMIASQFTVNKQTSKLRLGVRNSFSNKLIGTLLLTWSTDIEEQCEVGFSFGKQYWNKGYGKEILQMLEKQLGTHEHIKTLKAWCIKENLASIHLFEKARFTKVTQNEYPQSNLYVKTIKSNQ